MRAEKELSVARLFSQSSPSDSSALKELLKREKRLTSPVYLSVSLSAGSESCSWCLLFNFPHIPAIFTSSSGQPDKEGMREENYVESATIPSFTSELATKEGVFERTERSGWVGEKSMMGKGRMIRSEMFAHKFNRFKYNNYFWKIRFITLFRIYPSAAKSSQSYEQTFLTNVNRMFIWSYLVFNNKSVIYTSFMQRFTWTFV